MKYTAFSIDNVSNPMICIQFKGWFEAMQRAHLMAGNLVQCVGKYKDDIEYSFLCLSEDFDIIHHNGWVTDQESVLEFSENNNQAAQLRFLEDDATLYVGNLKYVPSAQALTNPDGWTYRPDLNKYWIIEVTQDEKRRRAALEAYEFIVQNTDSEIADRLAEAFGFTSPYAQKAPKLNMEPTDNGAGFRIIN